METSKTNHKQITAIEAANLAPTGFTKQPTLKMQQPFTTMVKKQYLTKFPSFMLATSKLLTAHLGD
jgi:hypothetical protein